MIFFVRHGETDFNKFNITQGQIDSSLNIIGLNQAKEVALLLKNENFDAMFCSSLTRAKQTMEEIKKYHNDEVVYDDRLMEVNKGKLQGNKNSIKVYKKFFKNPHRFGGENNFDVYTRVNNFLKDIENFKGKNILVVSHGGIHKYFNFCLQNKNIKKDEIIKTRMKNCEIYKFDF